MKTAGIIAEYNPFHMGHKYHIEQTKKITNADKIIVIMSGNYVQRGEPAIIDKWTRAKMALLNGADIVIELPSIYSSSSAEFFALSSVGLLNSLNVVDCICFGSENTDIEQMYKTAELLTDEPTEYKNLLKSELDKGLVFPAARAKAIKNYLDIDSSFLDTPNNILGIEYIKALIKLNSNIKPFTILRNTAGYHSTDISMNIASATAIRLALKNNSIENIKQVIPENCFEILKNNLDINSVPVFYDNFSMILQYKLRTMSPKKLSNILDVNEGLENRILETAYSNFLISGIVNKVKTKRYTYTKIQRAILHILLDITQNDFLEFNSNGFCQYARILGFRKESQDLLSLITKKSTIPVIINIKKDSNTLTSLRYKMFEQEILFTDTYFLGLPNDKLRQGKKEYTQPVVII